MKRILGDEHVSIQLRAVSDLILKTQLCLLNCDYLGAAMAITRTELVFNGAMSDLERITDIPWTAIPEMTK